MALVSARLFAACTFTQSLRFISFFHHLLLLEVLQTQKTCGLQKQEASCENRQACVQDKNLLQR